MVNDDRFCEESSLSIPKADLTETDRRSVAPRTLAPGRRDHDLSSSLSGATKTTGIAGPPVCFLEFRKSGLRPALRMPRKGCVKTTSIATKYHFARYLWSGDFVCLRGA